MAYRCSSPCTTPESSDVSSITFSAQEIVGAGVKALLGQ